MLIVYIHTQRVIYIYIYIYRLVYFYIGNIEYHIETNEKQKNHKISFISILIH